MSTVSAYLQDAAEAIAAAAGPERDATVEKAAETVAAALREDRPFLVCGNGGSAADAMHITGELVGRFLRQRRALNAICLSSNPAVLTAWSNDEDFATVFSRQVEAHGRHGGAILGISTSGNSANVVHALAVARRMGMTAIGLTGEGGGAMAAECDILLDAPSRHTPVIQQVHICLYHYLCQRIEELCS